MWLYLLLIAVPVAYIADTLQAPPLLIFALAALGLIPLAGLIGQSTEALAARMGHGIGGLLNATFGNAAEIIIGIIALRQGLPEVVRSSLAGSIIGNVLLVLGGSMLVGGWRYRLQTFNSRVAGQYSVMLILAVIGIAIPSLLATIGEGIEPGAIIVSGNQLHEISIGISIILLLCYGAYISYSVFGLRADAEIAAAFSGGTSHDRTPEDVTDTQEQIIPSNFISRFSALWTGTRWLPLLALALSTVLTAIVSELLVGSIEPLTEEIGLSPFFVGLIIIPLVGNAAEHFTAITAAAHNHTEISMAITAGSSIQIALLAAPLLVIAGLFIGTPLDLNFTLFEVALFGLAAVLYAFISLDGESTWLEGLLLLAFYGILAVGIFFTPVR